MQADERIGLGFRGFSKRDCIRPARLRDTLAFMQISREEARRIATLAHLRFEDAALDRMAAQMTGILSYIEQLSAAPGGAADLVAPLPAAPLRDDLAVRGLEREAVAANAPAWSEGYFLVPRVLGE